MRAVYVAVGLRVNPSEIARALRAVVQSTPVVPPFGGTGRRTT